MRPPILLSHNSVDPRWRELNAFTYLDPRFEADLDRTAGEAAITQAKDPLAGFRLVVKDNIDVAGMPCTAGTPGLRHHVPKRDAPAIRLLRAAGAQIIAKTNMHELAYGITSNSAAFGPVRNVYDLTCFAGGSSGGTAAAIAAGLVRSGLGTDTGGSARIPAALNGIVGFKPTIGRYPMGGVAMISPTRDVIGPMGRTVRDVAELDAILAGIPSAELADVQLRGLRIGVPAEHFQEGLHADVALALQEVASKLRGAGVVLVEADLENIAALEAAASFPIVLGETKAALESYLLESGLDLTLAQLHREIASPDVKEIIGQVLGDVIPPEVYRHALTVARPQVQQLYQKYFTTMQVAAALIPTTPLPACPIEGSDRFVSLNGQSVPTFATFIRNTGPASVAGIPGISVPVELGIRDGYESSRLPVGVELDGPAGSDRRLLAIAAAVESVLRK